MRQEFVQDHLASLFEEHNKLQLAVLTEVDKVSLACRTSSHSSISPCCDWGVILSAEMLQQDDFFSTDALINH
jgi:hypothetical protein